MLHHCAKGLWHTEKMKTSEVPLWSTKHSGHWSIRTQDNEDVRVWEHGSGPLPVLVQLTSYRNYWESLQPCVHSALCPSAWALFPRFRLSFLLLKLLITLYYERTSSKLLNPTYKTFKVNLTFLLLFPRSTILYNTVTNLTIHEIGKNRIKSTHSALNICHQYHFQPISFPLGN